jgi:ATP synthase protein I
MSPCFFWKAAEGPLAADQDRERPRDEVGESYRKAAPYLDASWQLVGSVVLWSAIGWFLDKKLHTAPWLLVSGSVIGIGLGFYLFFKALSAIGRKPR